MNDHCAVMSLGDTLREAMRRHRITSKRLAAKLGLTESAVKRQCERDNWEMFTLERYAQAMSEVIHDSGDMRAFTPDSLRTGSLDPLWPLDLQPDVIPVSVDRPTMTVRYFGRVPCGPPIDIDGEPVRMLTVWVDDVPRGWTEATGIVVEATETSMVPTIHPGDRVWVRTDLPPVHDCVVLAAINGRSTLKRYREASNGVAILVGDRDGTPIVLTEGDECVVQGRAVQVDHRRAL